MSQALSLSISMQVEEQKTDLCVGSVHPSSSQDNIDYGCLPVRKGAHLDKPTA